MLPTGFVRITREVVGRAVSAAVAILTAQVHNRLNEFLEAHIGLVFSPEKRGILEARLRPRLAALALASFEDYYQLLRSTPDGELAFLANAVTNNETYFFREPYQFEALYREALPLLASGLVLPGKLRILCAGCSSGEEAYTLVFCHEEYRRTAEAPTPQVDAFDVDPVRVEMARRAQYRERSVRDMTEAQIQRYLHRPALDRYCVRPEHRTGVTITRGNIVDLQSFQGPLLYDVLFCRNTLIYFATSALRVAVDNFARVLRPNGILFLGHAESIIGMSGMFEPARLSSCVAYRRVVP